MKKIITVLQIVSTLITIVLFLTTMKLINQSFKKDSEISYYKRCIKEIEEKELIYRDEAQRTSQKNKELWSDNEDLEKILNEAKSENETLKVKNAALRRALGIKELSMEKDISNLMKMNLKKIASIKRKKFEFGDVVLFNAGDSVYGELAHVDSGPVKKEAITNEYFSAGILVGMKDGYAQIAWKAANATIELPITHTVPEQNIILLNW